MIVGAQLYADEGSSSVIASTSARTLSQNALVPVVHVDMLLTVLIGARAAPLQGVSGFKYAWMPSAAGVTGNATISSTTVFLVSTAFGSTTQPPDGQHRPDDASRRSLTNSSNQLSSGRVPADRPYGPG